MTAAAELDRRSPGPGRRVLTAVEFDVLWEWLGLGATPVVLRLDSPGRTHTERRAIVASGWHGLRERGLADVTGPDPEIVRLMHLLAAPRGQLELRMRLGRELRVVAATRAGVTTLAVRQDATVTLSAAPGPVSAIVRSLPAAPAGPGFAVTVPSEALEASIGSPGVAVAEGLRRRGVPAEDAEQVESMVSAVRGRGQLSVLAADQWGVLHRLRRVLGVLDTARGRYLMQRDTAADGVEWTTLCPVDVPRTRHRLDRLLVEARTHAGRT
ncbi:MAG TPA: ESX secretion-associated protein EspG [Pseudonocardia sp.]|jgi:hypothetical protein